MRHVAYLYALMNVITGVKATRYKDKAIKAWGERPKNFECN